MSFGNLGCVVKVDVVERERERYRGISNVIMHFFFQRKVDINDSIIFWLW